MSARASAAMRKAKPAKPARKPGRIAARRDKAVNAVARKAAPSVSALALSAACQQAHAALHLPPLGYAWMTAGGIVALRGRDGIDAIRARRSGGKAAERRRRKYQGTASAAEVHAKLSVRAARKRAKVTRPSLRGRIPVAEAGIVIGKGGMPRRTLAATHEDVVLVFAPPRSGKTGWLSGVVLDAPGAVVTTSTRVDVHAHTLTGREARGPVYTLNPGGDGAIPTTLLWSPLTECGSAAGATERAGYLMAAAPKDSSGRDAWWDAKGHVLLRLMLHAAALDGASMIEAKRWTEDPYSAEPASILATSGAAPGWADELAALTRDESDQMRGIIASASAALAWMSDWHMARVACPLPGEDRLDAWDFVTGNGTLYLIGTDRPHNSLAPYFACLTAHLFDTAKRVASVSDGARLDPPLTLVLDEPAITCPVPMDRWSAESGGHGITLVTGFQSPAQIAARWGDHAAQAIRDNASVQLVMGGHTNPAELEALSAVCGNRDTWEQVKGPGGTTRSPKTERLYPPERLRTLPAWHAVLLHRSARPVTVKLTPVWQRKGYQRAPAWAGPQPAPATLAIGPPRTFAVAASGLPEIQELTDG